MTATAHINLDALRNNVARLVETVAPADVMLAVKTNAYGHGLVEVAQTALSAGARRLAVLEPAAGIQLREAGISAPLFAWLFGEDTEWKLAIDSGIDLGISRIEHLDAIARAGAERPAQVHLKIDTGLHRNGASSESWPHLVQRALDLARSGIIDLVAAWSHLADASPEDDEDALRAFDEAITEATALGARFQITHIAASSAGLRMPHARRDAVRFGIIAYGISPFDNESAIDLGFQQVMSLTAPVTEVTEQNITIAAGFADGVHSTRTKDAFVTVKSHPLRIERVDVDHMVVAPHDDVNIGDTALIFGDGRHGEATAEVWAAWANTIGDEIVTHVTPRVPRTY